MEAMQSELSKKEIRGINLRIIIPVAVFLITATGYYFGMKNQINNLQDATASNRELLIDIKNDAKDQNRLNDARMNMLESSQRELNLRLTIMETELKDHKQP